MTESNPYSLQEKQVLLDLAINSISTYLESLTLPDYQQEYPALLEPAAVFVTLFSKSKLRGCVGQIQAEKPLYAAVQDAARSAAFSDPRFPPVTQSELDKLHIKIAILSEFTPIQPEEIVIGRHGLLIEHQFQRGLLLPEVASERNWDSETFLDNLCYKASLPPGTWRIAEKLLGFTTYVIEFPD